MRPSPTITLRDKSDKGDRTGDLYVPNFSLGDKSHKFHLWVERLKQGEVKLQIEVIR